MGAPQQAYFLIDAKFRGSNNVEQIVNPAKAQAILATLKARFYLDDVIAFKAVWAGVEYHGFWGTVLLSGFNYDHHKTSRLLEINGPKPGQILRTLNDAGLNTMGDVMITTIPRKNANRIKINITIKSSFYADSSEYGIEYKLSNSGLYTEAATIINTIIKEETLNTQYTLATPFAIFDTINVRPFVINPEGRYYGPVETITLAALIYDLLTSLRSVACTATADNRVVYVKGNTFDAIQNNTITTSTQRLGFFAYKDEDFSIAADDGYYTFFNVTEDTRIYQVNLAGEIISYSICAAPPAPIVYVDITLTLNASNRIVVNVNSPITWSGAIQIIGTVQAYANIDDQPDARYTRSFTINIPAGSTFGAQTLILTYDSAFYYEVINEGISPTSLDGNTLQLTKAGI